MKNLTLYYKKANNKWWSQPHEKKEEEEKPREKYDIKKDLEKIEKEVKEQNICFNFWEDKKNNEFWISKNIDTPSERWKQYKGSIEELQKLTFAELYGYGEFGRRKILPNRHE
jgi:hypothetical protein